MSGKNQWNGINRELQLYRIFACALGALAFFAVILSCLMYFASPIVVVKDGAKNEYLSGKHADQPIADSDIDDLIRRWITLRYEWNSFDPWVIIRNVAPFTTDGLSSKIQRELETLKAKDFKDKELSEYVGKNMKITIQENQVEAEFDRVMRINGIPIVDAGHLSFSLVKGQPNAHNPLGVYINGITEFNAK